MVKYLFYELKNVKVSLGGFVLMVFVDDVFNCDGVVCYNLVNNKLKCELVTAHENKECYEYFSSFLGLFIKVIDNCGTINYFLLSKLAKMQGYQLEIRDIDEIHFSEKTTTDVVGRA